MYICCNHIIMNYLTAKVLLCVCVGGGGVYTNTTESLILKIIWLYRYAFGIRLVFFPQDQCYFIELRCKKKIWIYINKLYNQDSTTFWFTFNSVTHYNECKGLSGCQPIAEIWWRAVGSMLYRPDTAQGREWAARLLPSSHLAGGALHRQPNLTVWASPAEKKYLQLVRPSLVVGC